MNSKYCSHCKKLISRGTRYFNKLSSVSVSDLIEITDPDDSAALKKEVTRLTRSTDTTKSEQQLMDEIFVDMTFDLCGVCRDKFVAYARNFTGHGQKH